MSEAERLIGETEARKKAEETLAFEIGNLPRLGEARKTESAYIFPLEVRLPRVIFDEDRNEPRSVKFLDSEPLGEIIVDATTGEVERPHLHRIEAKIRQKQREIETAVQKALVRSSAEEFSRLPFPEHRYTPILDVLSHLIIEGPISADELSMMKSIDEQKYRDYVELLEGVNLVRWREDRIEADNILIEIQADGGKPPEQLNAAMAHFFEAGADTIEPIREILGPHLLLTGHYYRRAIELDDLPDMDEAEFDEVLERNYTGGDRTQKQIKLSRYLIQLEEVNLLESTNGTGPRRWKGRDTVKRGVLKEEELLEPIIEIMA